MPSHKIAVIGNTIMCDEVLRRLKDDYDFHRLAADKPDGICDYRVSKSRCTTTLSPEPHNDIATLTKLKPVLTIVLGCSGILPREVLNIAKYGTIGFHAARLPQHRGCAPIPHTILDNLGYTAMTMMYLNAGIDTGEVIAEKGFYVTETDTATTLYKKHTTAAYLLLQEWLPELLKGRVSAQAQEGEERWWGKRAPEESEINWWNNPYDTIRAVQFPYPPAFVMFEGEPLYITEAYRVDLIDTPDWKAGTSPNIIADIDEVSNGIVMPDGIIITKVRYMDREFGAYDFATEYELQVGDKL